MRDPWVCNWKQRPLQYPNPDKSLKKNSLQSSGATLAAVAQKQDEMQPGSRVIIFSYDTGERYLSIEDLF